MRDEEIQYFGWSDKINEYVNGFINVEHYPSGEPLIHFPGDDVFISRILLRPRSMTGFLGGLFLVDAIKDRGHETPDLILPFVPGARQDRLNDSGDYLFS